MENFLRLSVKINNILCILIVLLSGLSYLVDMRKDKDVASWGIGVSLTFCVFLIILSLIAKRGLTLMIRDDDNIKAYKVMRAGIVFAGCLMAFFILGLAIGISTGMVSYLYILLILATGFYLFCMLKVRPPKPDVLGGGEGKEYAEPLLDVIHEIPDTEFFEEGASPYDYDTESVVKEYHLPEETHDFKELHGFGSIDDVMVEEVVEDAGEDVEEAEEVSDAARSDDAVDADEAEDVTEAAEADKISDIDAKATKPLKTTKPKKAAEATKSTEPKIAEPSETTEAVNAEEEQLVMDFSNAKSNPDDFIAQYEQFRKFEQKPKTDPKTDPKTE